MIDVLGSQKTHQLLNRVIVTRLLSVMVTQLVTSLAVLVTEVVK